MVCKVICCICLMLMYSWVEAISVIHSDLGTYQLDITFVVKSTSISINLSSWCALSSAAFAQSLCTVGSVISVIHLDLGTHLLDTIYTSCRYTSYHFCAHWSIRLLRGWRWVVRNKLCVWFFPIANLSKYSSSRYCWLVHISYIMGSNFSVFEYWTVKMSGNE